MLTYVTPNWHRACDTLSNYEWARDVLKQGGPRTSRLIRQAKADLRTVEQTEPPVQLVAQ